MPPGAALLAGTRQTGGKRDYCWVVWRKDVRRDHPATHWAVPRPEHAPERMRALRQGRKG
ncbi:hypothetical protein CCP1ISM_670007 [Azospirillaceae bacterium]